MILVLIGPMGCGKTTVGRLLAARLGWPFDDADDFHPPANIAKMKAGTPLEDSDRLGWLASLRERIDTRRQAGEHLVLACSALKKSYRDLLGIDQRQVVSIYLKGSPDLLRRRIESRSGHFMPGGLLASQLSTMEEPADGIIVTVDHDPATVVSEIESRLHTYQGLQR